jgi:hypothetical protein
MRDQSGVIPKEAFGRLSSESRKAWSQLSDDVRVDILRALQVNGSQHSQEWTMMPLLHLLSRRPCMTPLQPALLHQPIQTWMNEYAMFFLTSLVRHMQMGRRTSSSPVSRNRQQASTVSGRNRRLRIFLQRIYVRCYPNVNDWTSHQS